MGDISAGSTNGVATTGIPTAHNMDEYATTGEDGHWTAFPKTSGSSLSYWLGSVRSDPLLDHRTTPNLPEFANTVVIGAGVSAVSFLPQASGELRLTWDTVVRNARG